MEINAADQPVDLTYAELHRALMNFGIDMRCPACAGIFYTGGTELAHDPLFHPVRSHA